MNQIQIKQLHKRKLQIQKGLNKMEKETDTPNQPPKEKKQAYHHSRDDLNTTINTMIKRRVQYEKSGHKKRLELINAGVAALNHCKTLENLEKQLKEELERMKQERSKKKHVDIA